MAFICNITFIIHPAEEERFLKWMREEAFAKLVNADGARTAKLMKVTEAGGEKPAPEHGLSIALHAEFTSESEAKTWHQRALTPILEEYAIAFGPDALFFTTLLESLNL